MIISRTPLRLSLLGGGTDYPQWYNEHGGAILGATIDKYCYVMLHNGHVWHTFDLPSESGLGSSSAYTVGLLRACTNLDGWIIARLATTWEQDKMAGNVGAQDQYLCALGGSHVLRFTYHEIRGFPVDLAPLLPYLMLFNTHQYRRGSLLIASQMAEMKRHKKLYLRLAEMVDEGQSYLQKNLILDFGRLLGDAWAIKKKLSREITTVRIDDIYNRACSAGAIGGKLLGGGGGGFMIFFAEPEKQLAIRKALGELTHVPFKFESEGTKVIYHD